MKFYTVASKPASLGESIHALDDVSEAFAKAWSENRIEDAKRFSEAGISLIDHIANELTRNRDQKKTDNAFEGSRLKAELAAIVGKIAISPSANEVNSYRSLSKGKGALSCGSLSDLNLETALAKLRHRSRQDDNFEVSSSRHAFFIYTQSGMGQKPSLAKIDMRPFCDACAAAEKTI